MKFYQTLNFKFAALGTAVLIVVNFIVGVILFGLNVIKMEVGVFVSNMSSFVLSSIPLVIISFWFLSKYLTGPIHNLMSLAKSASESDDDVKIKVETGDEIEELSDAMNSIFGSLKISQHQIGAFADSLEKEVLKRTAEVEEESKLKAILNEILHQSLLSKGLRRFTVSVIENTIKGKGVAGSNSGSFFLFDDEKRLKRCAYINTSPETIEHCEDVQVSQELLKSLTERCQYFFPANSIDAYSFIIADSEAKGHYTIPIYLGDEITAILTLSTLDEEENLNTVLFLQSIGDVISGVITKLETQENLESSLVVAEKSRVEAEKANLSKSEFLANMSHEIRTPLNSIVGFTELLSDTTLIGEQQDYVNTINSATIGLNDLVSDILDISKIENGQNEMTIKSFELLEVCEEIATSFSFVAREKGVQLYLDYSDELGKIYAGDVAKIQKLLQNLLSNATKFTESGFVKLSVGLVGGVAKNTSKYIDFRVEDSGVGIPEDSLEAIFNKFTQIDSSSTKKFGGTGLGLSICKSLCEVMGGSITVKSILGEGTVFSCKLPLEQQKEDWAKPINFSDQVCLFYTSDLHLKPIVERHLRKLEIPFEVCTTIKETQEKLSARDSQVTFVVVDHQGESLEEIHPDNLKCPYLPVIVLGNSISPYAKNQDASPYAAWILKPFVRTYFDRVLIELFVAFAPVTSQTRLEESKFGANVLLVDDNPLNRKLAQKLLEKAECTAITAEDGLEAVKKATDGEYDLIFMDCQMPIMDGYEASRKIRECEQKEGKGKHRVIVALTANALDSDREKCLSAGMDDFIAKPVSKKKIQDILSKWVARNDEF